MRSHIASEIRKIENKIIANNKTMASAAKINKIICAEIAETENRIAELRAQQADINQNTDSQEKTESKEQHEKTDSEEQHDNHKPEPETSPEYYEPADTSQKKKPGESRASHEPPLPRIRIKICKGGEGGNHHRKACFDCRALRTRPSLGRGGVEAVISARPIYLPLYGPVRPLSLFCRPMGSPRRDLSLDFTLNSFANT